MWRGGKCCLALRVPRLGRSRAGLPRAGLGTWQEDEQRQQIKSQDFYDREAEQRRYFYHIDLQGRLFIEDVMPKNVATCLKSDKFLSFFFSRLRPNTSGIHRDYPLMSPCGKEMNFIKPADTGIVFNEVDWSTREFVFSGGARQTLDPSAFSMSSDNGRLYHRLSSHRFAEALGGWALLRSSLALELSETAMRFQGRPSHRRALL
uniref:Uncharacterized protein n=1 Tax=Rhizochromulina marina TaxID=1034831 RepID=A0A7S2RG64_9STRA|mmetsp:Transcript_15802/g.46510  ORF Transcript_15802/g.46510 Transcript_15802/m.46510 type:complete len:205 (+) Transcript_15802:43-657(+)